MEQAKWYEIWFQFDHFLRKEFHYLHLLTQLEFDGLKRVIPDGGRLEGTCFGCLIFCGKKKLNMLLIEAHLLGLEDELLMFERKGEK